MKEKIKELIKEKIIKNSVSIFFILMILYVAILIWKWQQLPPQLPLFYSLPKSNEQLATPIQLLTLPFFSLLFYVINFFAAAVLYPKEKLGSILLVITGTIVTGLLFYAFIQIVFLVS
ncbi:hypothetical protein FJY90_04060 [Candidatus Gottesmanbacteria bacterium]|nr:hypothetical protein [Candidatus Gottesmanbacteria bacterium]